MSVKDLDINPKYVTALLKGRVHEVRKLLSHSKWEVVKRTGLGENAVREIFKTAAKYVSAAVPCSTVLDIVNGCSHPVYQFNKIPTYCRQLDNQLGGGVLYPGVTEICGESGSGKTQLAIHLCLTAQLQSGNAAKEALYVCTEDAFPTKRLYQMAQHFVRTHGGLSDGADPSKLTDSIYVEHCVDLEDLWTLLDVRLPSLLSKVKLKVVVIDSIAALFRTEFDLSDMGERAKMLAKFGRRLHDISWRENLCVLCINQVSDVFDEKDFSSAMNASDGCRSVTPALGLTWSYSVDTRLMISRTQWKTSMFAASSSHGQEVLPYDVVIRSLRVIFASHLPPSKSYFIVDENGIKDFIFPQTVADKIKKSSENNSRKSFSKNENNHNNNQKENNYIGTNQYQKQEGQNRRHQGHNQQNLL